MTFRFITLLLLSVTLLEAAACAPTTRSPSAPPTSPSANPAPAVTITLTRAELEQRVSSGELTAVAPTVEAREVNPPLAATDTPSGQLVLRSSLPGGVTQSLLVDRQRRLWIAQFSASREPPTIQMSAMKTYEARYTIPPGHTVAGTLSISDP